LGVPCLILNQKEKDVIKEPKGGKRVTFEEYKKEMEKVRKSIFGNKKKN
jgi:hypothetical protein